MLAVEYGISSDSLFAMSDYASVNMHTMKVIFPKVLDVGCSHRDHDREHFYLPTLDECGLLWISLFSHSHWAKAECKQLTGIVVCTVVICIGGARSRSGSCTSQLLSQFEDVIPFLRAIQRKFLPHKKNCFTTLTYVCPLKTE